MRPAGSGDFEVAAKEQTRKRPRRTQEERRETTRAALLDATIDCLIEHGYADTTTSKVVEMAGVSRGAQVHHFPTKAELVTEALHRLARRRLAEVRDELEAVPRGAGRSEATLEILHKHNSGPIFAASLELWVAARTDPELRRSLVPLEREIAVLIRDELAAQLPEDTPAEAVNSAATSVIALILGLGLQSELLQSRRAADAAWEAVRGQLLAIVERAGG